MSQNKNLRTLCEFCDVDRHHSHVSLAELAAHVEGEQEAKLLQRIAHGIGIAPECVDADKLANLVVDHVIAWTLSGFPDEI